MTAFLLTVVFSFAVQDIPVQGRVIGPDTLPVANQTVMLHRVDASGGATVAEADTDADGEFVLQIPAGADTSAVYFVAARYDGELYIGSPFRAEAGIGTQLLRVGVPEMSATALLEGTSPQPPQPMGRPATSRNWLLLIIPLLGVITAAVWMLVPRGRIPEDRRLLIRVAELEQRIEAAPADQRETLRTEHDRLMEQLRAR